VRQAAVAVGPAGPARRRPRFQTAGARKFLAFGGLIGLVIIFSLASPYFLTLDNVIGILLATSVNGILALGATFVIITAGIDLSVGTVMTMSAVVTAILISVWGWPVPVGLLGGLATGALAGLVNGVAVSKMKVPPFVATLGVMMAAKGLALVTSGSKPIYFSATPVVQSLTMDSAVGSVIPAVPLPNAVFFLFGAAAVASLILGKTVLGRYTFAIGSNEEAIRLSGVNVDFWKAAVYVVCGLFSGLAGLVIASRLNSAQPSLGSGYELDAIAAVVIGGTSLSGGEGSILGTVIGAFVMSVLTNGLRILSVAQEWQLVVTGGIVIIAVYADVLRRRRQ
jgi:ribose transport system permease protein